MKESNKTKPNFCKFIVFAEATAFAVICNSDGFQDNESNNDNFRNNYNIPKSF